MQPTYSESNRPNNNNGYNNNYNSNYVPNQNIGGVQITPSKQPHVYPQFAPTKYPINPIPGSQGTSIGTYPPRPIDTELAYPNFSVAISRWPFYALPFPFNIESFADINASLGGSGGTGSGYPGVVNPTPADCGCNKTNSQHSNHNQPQTPSAQIIPTSGSASPQNYYNQPNGNPNQHPGTYGGIIGFIPIVFFPAPCQQNSGTAYPLFPEAFPFQQGPCSNCGSNHQNDQSSFNNNERTITTNEQRRSRTAKDI